jgi:histidinol dehydrogenase
VNISRFDWDGRDAAALVAELRALQPSLGSLGEDVAAIIADVAERGDEAVLELDERFSGVSRQSPRVPAEAVEAASEAVPELVEPLRYAASQIRRVAEAEAAAETETETEGDAGQTVRMRSLPVAAAGAYVPGGTASYPSSALMCCIPARAAGVSRVVAVSPPGRHGDPDPVVMAACAIAEVDEVYAMGGVQAIAALALGTESVAPVDVVVGPGNRFVQEAKRQVFGRVGVDGIAGPSELMVILGPGASPTWAANDLCAQGEHGPEGLLLAAGDGETLANLETAIGLLAEESERTLGEAPLALVEVPNPEAALELANALAPEHLELAFDGAEDMADSVTTAGCVFVGPAAGAAYGDYAAGSNHVLPTGGAGRFMGPLGPRAFRRRIATVSISPEAASELASPVATLADAEGFPLHAQSAQARIPDPSQTQRIE